VPSSLKQQSLGRHVNQTLLLLLKASCLTEKQQIPRAHQTRRSGWLLCLGFNEIAQFLSKSFSRPVSVNIFFTNNHTFSSIFPCSWNLTHTGFDVQYFIPNSLIASFLRSLCSRFVLWKVGEHAVVEKEMLKFGSIFGSLPDFSSLRP
jgi:hypothetical protein